MSNPQHGGHGGTAGQQQQFDSTGYRQQGDNSSNTLAAIPPVSSKFKQSVPAQTVYQQLTLLAAKNNDGTYAILGEDHVAALIERQGQDGAKLHKQTYRDIGNSNRADYIVVFAGQFNAAQKKYLNNAGRFTFTATDPDLKYIQPWPSSATASKTEDSFARLAPD